MQQDLSVNGNLDDSLTNQYIHIYFQFSSREKWVSCSDSCSSSVSVLVLEPLFDKFIYSNIY